MTGKHIYNMVSDNITGVNVRKKDNLFQFIAIIVSMMISVVVAQLLFKFNNGLLWFESSGDVFLPSLIFGFFAGAIIDGGAIAIYRFVSHIRGNHD